jgi:hypothetical protein
MLLRGADVIGIDGELVGEPAAGRTRPCPGQMAAEGSLLVLLHDLLGEAHGFARTLLFLLCLPELGTGRRLRRRLPPGNLDVGIALVSQLRRPCR